MRTWWLVVVALCGCASSASVECAFGLTCPEGTICDQMHTGCAVQQQFDVCAGKDERSPCTTDDIGEGVCDLGVCLGPSCGDGVRTPAEICDGSEIASDDTCAEFGFYGGSLTCTAACTLELRTCSGSCGDGMINGPEICDGALPTTTCVDEGFGAGFLQCSDTCGPQTDECIPFGWRVESFPHKVNAVHGTAANNVWVVGDGGMVQRFDGVEWHELDITACDNSDLFDVFVFSETDAVVVTIAGVIHLSATGCVGRQMTNIIDGLWGASPGDIYAGTINGLYHFNGTAWQLVNGEPSRTLWGRGVNDLYRADELVQSEIQHYNGQSFTPIAVPSIGVISAIWGTADELFVSGTCGAGTVACVMRRNSLGAWDAWLDGRAGYDSGAYAARGAGSSQRTFVTALNSTNGGAVLGTDGNGWANLDAPFFDLQPNLYLAPEGTFYLVTRQGNRLFVFDGTAHVETSPPPERISSIAVGAADDVVVIANDEACGWNGVSWAFEANNVKDATATPSGAILVVGASGVRERTAPGVYSTAKLVAGDRIVGQTFSDFFVRTTLTTIVYFDGTAHSTPFPHLVRDLVSVTPSLAIAVGEQGLLYHWTPGANGGTWTPQSHPLTGGYFHKVAAYSATDAFAMTNSELIHYNGVAWTMHSIPQLPFNTYLLDVYGSAGDLFLGTTVGLFHYDGTRWDPVDTGDISPVEHLAGVGTSLFWVEPGNVDQLVRTRPW